MKSTILAVFPSRSEAEDALDDLMEAGYDAEDISLILKDKEVAQQIHEDTGADIVGGTISGATTGGALGALAGFLVATGVIPGIGVLLIGGPIAAALGLTGAAATTISGAVTGFIAGGLLGALTSLGLSEEDAKIYEQRIQEGWVFMAIPAIAGREDMVIDILQNNGADEIKTMENIEAPSRIDSRYEPDRYQMVGAKGGLIDEIDSKSTRKSRLKRR